MGGRSRSDSLRCPRTELQRGPGVHLQTTASFARSMWHSRHDGRSRPHSQAAFHYIRCSLGAGPHSACLIHHAGRDVCWALSPLLFRCWMLSAQQYVLAAYSYLLVHRLAKRSSISRRERDHAVRRYTAALPVSRRSTKRLVHLDGNGFS
jgi:hypothetical protein